ncbi:hypothetical protein [Leptolyngbya sp. KIOST-1]|uniref:hypothetical protein n=1 Tax=Leptolyngbya sp. KIOST-1 TaxID=1229172 RepID=UPI00056A7233|nr:hypothetical protein [Leptolyngbya sp. KIOST-1]
MTSLVAGQIVFLECRQTRLYAEVIQVLEPRSTGWIRPLALVNGDDVIPLGTAFDTAIAELNKPAVPDMLWPLDQLQPALDTEVIPLIANLSAKAGADSDQINGQASLQVNDFVRSLWADQHHGDQSSD